jgi:outer membrane biosynthesis protein TonB
MRRKVDELRRDAAWRQAPDADEEPLHALPDAPIQRRGPFSVSAGLHLLVLFLLLVTSWISGPPPTVKPDLSIVFQEPAAPHPAPAAPLPPPPRAQSPPVRPRAPEAAPPREAKRPPITPPAVPKELPPPTPLPPPKRMGEQVPVPHYPVPGTVPPAGKVREPAPPEQPRQQAAGTPEGDREKDPARAAPAPRERRSRGPIPDRIPPFRGHDGTIEVRSSAAAEEGRHGREAAGRV